MIVITVKTYPNGQIVEIEKPDGVRFPYSIRQILNAGHRDYSNYGVHTSKDRLKNYLSRSAGIRDKSGKLTKDDPFSANYWARRVLWNHRALSK